MCNLHGPQTKQGVTALVNSVLIQQYVNSNFPLSRSDLESNHHPDIWIESGALHFGPVYIEGSLSGHSNNRQNVQYSQHVFLQVCIGRDLPRFNLCYLFCWLALQWGSKYSNGHLNNWSVQITEILVLTIHVVSYSNIQYLWNICNGLNV